MARKQIILLSGPLAVGKTTVRDSLIIRHSFDYIKSGRYLIARAAELHIPVSRTSLQDLGDKFDIETDYRWLVDDVALPAFRNNAVCQRWIVDAVRKERQVTHFRSEFQSMASVFHVHLTAPDDLLESRYEKRGADSVLYPIACAHDNEVATRALVNVADWVCDTSKSSADDLADNIMSANSKRSG